MTTEKISLILVVLCFLFLTVPIDHATADDNHLTAGNACTYVHNAIKEAKTAEEWVLASAKMSSAVVIGTMRIESIKIYGYSGVCFQLEDIQVIVSQESIDENLTLCLSMTPDSKDYLGISSIQDMGNSPILVFMNRHRINWQMSHGSAIKFLNEDQSIYFSKFSSSLNYRQLITLINNDTIGLERRGISTMSKERAEPTISEERPEVEDRNLSPSTLEDVIIRPMPGR